MAEQAISLCDCAILAMDATAAFSSSEKMFLQERLLVKKIPRIMVVLTKLDMVDEQWRKNVVELVREKLSSMADGVPLFLSFPDMLDGWEALSGTEAIQRQLIQWLNESDHSTRKKGYALTTLKNIAENLSGMYACQLEVLSENENKRKEFVEKRKQQLQRDSQVRWETLEVEMLHRCNRNFDWIRSITDERQNDIIERLQLEISHAAIPKDWLERDFPYRIKMEMIALGKILENHLQNFYTRDIGWLNQQLQETYGITVPLSNPETSYTKIGRQPIQYETSELEDMRRTRTISRVGTGGLTIAGYAIGGALGFSPIGMAIGLAGGMVSEVFMHHKIEAQKDQLSAEIREKLPAVIRKYIEEAENNLRALYSETICTMKQSCEEWVEIKKDAMDAAQTKGSDETAKNEILEKLSMLKKISEM